MNVNVNLMVENETQIKSAVTINVGTSVKIKKKHRVCKKVIFGILLHVLAKMVNI